MEQRTIRAGAQPSELSACVSWRVGGGGETASQKQRRKERGVGLGESSMDTNAALLVLEILLDLVFEIPVRPSAYMDIALLFSFRVSFFSDKMQKDFCVSFR